jgi:divalent anion:Na+ symporter, DASS family
MSTLPEVASPECSPRSGTWIELLRRVRDGSSRPARWALPALAYCAIAICPPLSGVSADGWRITGVFLATMVAIALRPLPPAVIVLGAVAFLASSGPDGPKRALVGYAMPGVWLVLAAMILSRALRESGLARRAALQLVRAIGTTSTRLAAALVLADVGLGAVIPSVTARNAGLILPVGVGLSEFFDSRPGQSANRLGAFLILVLYQCSTVVCAMFLTGQASNVLIASMAQRTFGVAMSWSAWFRAGVVPALVSCLLILVVVRFLAPPAVRETPQAADYARRELAALGPITRKEITILVITVGSCLLFATSGLLHLNVTAVALSASVILLASGVTSWESNLSDPAIWDLFVWYGGFFSLAEALATSGTPAAIASSLGSLLGGYSPYLTFVLASGAAFLAHYLFASITAQVLTMFLPLAMVLVHAGVAPAMACFGMAFVFNLSAGLTHYGVTNGPVLFATNYVSLRTWWRVGFLVGLVNFAVWLGVGLVWWKVIGLW